MQSNDTTKRPIKDLIYSFVAYALPTVMLQFVVLPLIAGRLSSEKNGLFLALFNAVRLCVGLFIAPLANVRLLKKKECIAEPDYDKGFNFLFSLVTIVSVICVSFLGMFYYDWHFQIYDMMRLLAVLVLLSAHDYFSISFRIDITYKNILIDNIMIAIGYVIGIGLMLKFGYWELVFISGYSLGLLYTLVKSKLWRKGIKPFVKKKTASEYCQLSASSGLNNATTYCDKMLIYPLIGGYSVSVYNAASVVSKMMALVSVPLRNVLLSYIVDTDDVSVLKPKRGKAIGVVCGSSLLIYGGFYIASIVLCRILYPQYFGAAKQFIPIILLAILFETYAGLLKTYLLRFESAKVQVFTSGARILLYISLVLIFNVALQLGLVGFCLSILIADCIHFVIVLVLFVKNLKKKFVKQNN